MKILKKETKKYSTPIPVFDVTIDEETPCFALEAGVISHNTKRWQAAQHTVPKMTELMDLRTTRYEDGIKLHYDYSQCEVRVLAKLSEDENLLKAFQSGLMFAFSFFR